MAPKEPTRAQLSSRLTYQQSKPAFLQKLQNKMAGIADSEDEDDEDEFEYTGDGRVPIPRRPKEKRPAIPQRPMGDPGSADEDEDFVDERPQIVVLKEGKHLTEREVENMKRKEKGLVPLPDPTEALKDAPIPGSSTSKSQPASKTAGGGLSFSSGSKGGPSKSAKKRKALGQLDEDKDASESAPVAKKTKKPKKEKKTLLSFGDDA